MRLRRRSSAGRSAASSRRRSSSPGTPAGQTVGEKRWAAGEAIGHHGRARPPRRLVADTLWPRPSPGGRRSSRRPTAAATSRRRSGSTPRSSPRWRSWCRSHRCTSRTTSPRSGRCWNAHPALPQVACFDTAMHRTQPLRRADVRAAPGAGRGRRAALRIPRHLVRVHRRSAARRRPARGAREDRRAPPRQRRQHVRAGGRTQHRDDDGLHGGGRAADGDAIGRRSIPACCCT